MVHGAGALKSVLGCWWNSSSAPAKVSHGGPGDGGSLNGAAQKATTQGGHALLAGLCKEVAEHTPTANGQSVPNTRNRAQPQLVAAPAAEPTERLAAPAVDGAEPQRGPDFANAKAGAACPAPALNICLPRTRRHTYSLCRTTLSPGSSGVGRHTSRLLTARGLHSKCPDNGQFT